MGTHWTWREKQFLRKNYLMLSDEDLGRRLGRGPFGIRQMRSKMGLVRPHQWRPAVDASLRSRKEAPKSVKMYRRSGNNGWTVKWWDGDRWRKMDYGRLWWWLNVGEPQPNEIIRHIDGDRMNIDPGNFQLVTLASLAKETVKLAHAAWSGAGKHWRRMEKYKQRKGTFDAREQDWL